MRPLKEEAVIGMGVPIQNSLNNIFICNTHAINFVKSWHHFEAVYHESDVFSFIETFTPLCTLLIYIPHKSAPLNYVVSSSFSSKYDLVTLTTAPARRGIQQDMLCHIYHTFAMFSLKKYKALYMRWSHLNFINNLFEIQFML
jgi:hypothetical protein